MRQVFIKDTVFKKRCWRPDTKRLKECGFRIAECGIKIKHPKSKILNAITRYWISLVGLRRSFVGYLSCFGMRGFTLIEAIAVVAILAVIAGIAAPVVLTTLERVEKESTWEEMENIYSVMIGDPEKGSYGYLADMGILPGSLSDLNSLVGSSYTMRSNGIGMGWNGPYLLKGKYLEDYLYDAWGSNYNYSFSYSNPFTGNKGELLIISNGPDKSSGTGDDIELRRSITTHQNIRVNVYNLNRNNWVPARNYQGSIYYSNSGVESAINFNRANPVAEIVHIGMHAIYARSTGGGPAIEGWKNIYVGEGTTSVDMYLR